MSEETGWRVTDSEYVIDTPFLRLRKDTIVLPNGRRIDDFYVRETRGFAVIFAITTDRNVVFVREYKHGIGESLLGLPAGMIEEDEEPAVCASRELAEETGYEGRAEFVRTFITDPVNSNSRFHLFVVNDAAATTTQSFDPTEDIAVELRPFAEVRALAREGAIKVGNFVAAIYAALEYLDAL
jgi:ADP-ribose pyrophosphatase